MSVITIPQLPTPEFFNQELNQYLGRLADAIWHIQPEIWEIIYAFKEAMEDKDRSRRHEQCLRWRDRMGCFGRDPLTAEQLEEIETDKEVATLKKLKVSELKTILRENRLQLSGEKYELMIKVLAFRRHGVKLKMQKVTERQKFKDIWECLEHAPQKMYDAAVKCQWSTEPLKKLEVGAVGGWSEASKVFRMMQRNRYYSKRSFSRYYCGHQLYELNSTTNPYEGEGGFTYNGDGWCGTK